ncbi:hypothetical protein ACOME3_000945 [Neoechinorhynchus agilis]
MPAASLITWTPTRMNHSFVYSPSDDTYTLEDAVISSFCLKEESLIAMEMGIGSGRISAALLQSQRFATLPRFLIGIDVNPEACLIAKYTLNGSNDSTMLFDIVCSDLTSAFRPTRFDIVMFNPPYVETEDCDVVKDECRSWAGGARGRVVVDSFISRIHDFVGGQLFLLTVSQNEVEDVLKFMKQNRLIGSVVLERKMNEHYYVIRAIGQ